MNIPNVGLINNLELRKIVRSLSGILLRTHDFNILKEKMIGSIQNTFQRGMHRAAQVLKFPLQKMGFRRTIFI